MGEYPINPDALVDAVVTIDTTGKIMAVNEAVQTVFGYTPQELLGQNIKLLMNRHYAAHHDHYLRRGSEAAKVINSIREVSALKKDGTEFPVEIYLFYEEHDGQMYITGHMRDLSERQAFLEQLMDQKVAAELANQAKSEFMRNMSHELRTPLNAILGYTQLASFKQNEPGELMEYMNQIDTAGRHLLNLINEVLDLTRIESGNFELEPQYLQVNDLISGCLELVKLEARKMDIQLLNQVQPCEDFVIYADALKTKQVLLNLLSNAIKYNKPGGAVTIGCDQQGQDQLMISISDEGRGIAPDSLQKIFNPFERLGAGDTGIEGVGIGLCITKRLIQAMGGRIEVESAVGKGTTFRIYFPRSMDMESQNTTASHGQLTSG